MTHEEIVKEFRKIEKYLQGRAKDIKKKYGEKPEFENETDEWHFELLMQVCKTVQEFGGVRPGISVQAHMNCGDGRYGIGI